MAKQKPHIKTVEAPAFERRALVDVSSVNTEERTFEVVYATETPVLRSPFFSEAFYEVLSMEGMREGRMDKGAPYLDNHNQHGSVTRDLLGVVESHWRSGEERLAKIKLSKRAIDMGIMSDIQDGILRNVSVGYRVYKYEEIPRAEGEKIPTYRATDWEAMEVSAVPVGADENSGIRSEGNTNSLHIHNMAKPSEGIEKPQNPAPQERGEGTTPPAVHTPATPPVNAEEVAQRAVEAERVRSTKIYSAADRLGLKRSVADELVNAGTDYPTAMERMLEKYEAADPASGVTSTQATVRADERDTERVRMAAGLIVRSAAPVNLTDVEKDGARQFRHDSMLDLAKRSLDALGVDHAGMHKMEVAKRAITQTGSDFPIVLENVLNKTLLSAYMTQADTWSRFCYQGSFTDFRPHYRLRSGSIGSVEKVPEGAEFKYKEIPDTERDSNQADTYGSLINLSRQAIINDDLGYFTRLSQMLGRSSARAIEEAVYALFALNGGEGPTLGDGVTMFDASRNNVVASGGAPSVVQFDSMRVLMAQQKDPSGNDFLDLRPEVGLFPIGLGGDARVVNDAQYDPDSNNKLQRPNKVRGLITDIVDTPRLTGTPYYFLTSADIDPVIEVGFLQGQTTPYLEQKMGFEVDGMTWKIRHDWGVGGIGFRGIVKNPGA